MSTLQISLAAAGIFLLALIVAFNAWQHWRRAPRQPKKPARSPDSSAAQAAGRFDPALDEADSARLAPPTEGNDAQTARPRPKSTFEAPELFAADATSPASGNDSAREPSLDGAPEPVTAAASMGVEPNLDTSASLSAPAQHGSSAVLHPLIDALATIEFAQPVAGETLLMVGPATSRAGSKPFRVEAHNAASDEWESIRVGQRYERLRAGVQLANRLGALNEIEFSEFAAKVSHMADSLGAHAVLPDMLQEVRRAAELDHFAAQNDVQLDFWLRVQQGAAWSAAFVEQHAQALGFVPSGVPGRWLLPAPQSGNAPVLTLSIDAQAAQSEQPQHNAVYEVQLGLDVPQVPQTEQPFAQLHHVAVSLCAQMNAVLCDQNGQPMGDAALQVIAPQLEEIYERLAAHNLSAGSPLARRLFS